MRTKLRLTAALTAVACIGLFAYVYAANNHPWVLGRAKLPLHDAGTAGLNFLAPLSQPCEIELEFPAAFPSASVKRMVMAHDQPSQLDIAWRVESRGRMLAEGSSRDALYIRTTNSSALAQLAFRMLNVSGLKGRPGTVGRGVGRFECKQSESYRVSAQVGEAMQAGEAAQAVAEASLIVRLSRTFGARSLARTLPLFQLAAVSGAASLLLMLAAFALKVRERSRKTP